jgi:hypothetical protein
LRATLILATLAGCYEGTFEGFTREPTTPRSGTFKFNVQVNGNAIGDFSGGSPALASASLSGHIDSDGRLQLRDYIIGTSDLTTIYVDADIADGQVSGIWHLDVNDRSLGNGQLSGELCSG